MRSLFRLAVLSVLLGLVAAVGLACSQSVSDSGAALQSAAPEVKKGWDTAMAAMKTNGYATAIVELQKIRNLPGVNATQGKAIDAASTKISDQMYAAANKDDPAAKAAIDELRNTMKR